MANKSVLLLVGILAIFGAIGYLATNQESINLTEESNDLDCGFSSHFATFLKNNGNKKIMLGYGSMNFERTDLKCAAYGGKSAQDDTIKKIPVIFVHGNSDVAFGRGTTDGYVAWQTGFRSLATYLTENSGYRKAELYTTTWGPANPNGASNNYHSKQYVTRMRSFVEAVLKYTGVPKVHIIGHSMGVSIGRKIIKGGSAVDHVAGNYDVGSSLKDRVATFVGLAGANLGLNACLAPTLPTCNAKDGFYPGLTANAGPSTYLNDLNKNGGSQGDKVYTIWSQYDDLIGSQCLVWGKVTSRIPNQNGEVVKASFEWNHFAVRDRTGPDLIGWL